MFEKITRAEHVKVNWARASQKALKKMKMSKKRSTSRNTDLRRWELRQKARPAQAIDQTSRIRLLISENVQAPRAPG